MKGLPESMVWEIAWLLHREIELGRFVGPDGFNSATRIMRLALRHGPTAAQTAKAVVALTPDQWIREMVRVRTSGAHLGAANDDKARGIMRRWQDLLAYAYHDGEWWRLDVWNPLLDARVPQRPHEPAGTHIANFSRLTSPWLRDGAKLWLSDALVSERYSWSTVKSRLDGLGGCSERSISGAMKDPP